MTKKELEQRIADLEAQVARLEARRPETHIHIGQVVPPAFPVNPYVYPPVTCGGMLTTETGPPSFNQLSQ